MIPNSGIDKIKVILAPYIFNRHYFNNTKHIDPHNELTLHKSGAFYYLSIHIEYMDLLKDFRLIITQAVYDLMFKNSPCYYLYGNFVNYIYENLNWFVIGISELELYFDVPRKNVSINQEAVDSGKLIQYNEYGKGKYSYYSSDYKTKEVKNTNMKNPDKNTAKKVVRHSRVHIYDKKEKYMKDNQIKHDEIDKHPFDIRLEFKLSRDNCKFMSLKNLNGNYSKVLSNYTELLATIYNRLIFDNVTVKGKSNGGLAKVARKAKDAGVRYTGKKLAKTDAISRDAVNGKRDENDRMKHMILEQKFRIGELPENAINRIKSDKNRADNDENAAKLAQTALE